MALTNKLTAIGNAIRAKTGKTDAMTLDAMVEEIGNISAETSAQMHNGDILDYIKVEVMKVVNKVRSVITDESIVYLAMSDTHYPGDQEGAWNQAQNNESNLHTAMAAKVLAYALPLDFVAHLGDVGNGEGSTTPDEMRAQIQKFVTLFEEAKGTIPCFIAIGNHDPGIYYHKEQTDGAIHTLAGNWLYDNFTAYSDSEHTVFGGVESGGYCYRDFPSKKLRVFLLNSAERLVTNQYDDGTSTTQQLWVANALKNLGSKSDAAEWQFIVLCHYPLDYGDARPISNIFKAYVKGESITIDGTTVSFSGCNGAQFVVQHHGHTHCFKYARLNGYDSSGAMTEYDAWRVAIPNVQYNRENYYTDPYYGVYFCEEESYPKTPDTANETSFVVNVYNRSENVLHSFCYGAGYDRTISLKDIWYYSVVTSLTGATVESSATTIKEGDPYIGTVKVTDGYELKSVSVIMGDKDITSERYTDGTISIPEVTGTISITVVAEAIPQNLIPLAVDTDGSIYNGIGYRGGIRLSTSDGGNREQSGMYASGWMPVSSTQTLRLTNIGTDTVNYNGSYLIGYTEIATDKTSGQVNLATLTTESDGSLLITPSMRNNGVCYFRLSCSYIGPDSSIYAE